MEGKREVWRSLQTGDLETAKLRAMETGLEVERQLHEARRRLKMRGSVDPETLAQDWKRRELEEEGKLRRETRYRETDDDLEALAFTISDHKEALSLGDTSLVERLLDRVLGEYGAAVPAKDRQRFARALLKARLESFEVSRKWAEAESPDDALMVSDLLERYFKHRRPPSKTEAEWRSVFRRFEAVNGALPVKNVKRV